MNELTRLREIARRRRLLLSHDKMGAYSLTTRAGDPIITGTLEVVEERLGLRATVVTMAPYFRSPEWLLLREQGAAAYQEYIESPAWKTLRQKALARDRTCRTCDSTQRLQVHHRKYPHRWKDDHVRHLIVLCYRCHEAIHASRA